MVGTTHSFPNWTNYSGSKFKRVNLHYWQFGHGTRNESAEDEVEQNPNASLSTSAFNTLYILTSKNDSQSRADW